MSFFFCPPSISCISKGVSTVLPRTCWAAYSSWYYMDSYFIKVLSLNHPGCWSATIWRYTGLLYMYLLSWREWVPGGMDAEDIPTTENSQTGVYGGGWLEIIHNYSILYKEGQVPCHRRVVPLKNICPLSLGGWWYWNQNTEEGYWCSTLSTKIISLHNYGTLLYRFHVLVPRAFLGMGWLWNVWTRYRGFGLLSSLNTCSC